MEAEQREAELAAMDPEQRARVEGAEAQKRRHSDAKKAMLKKQMAAGGVYKSKGFGKGKGGRGRGRGRGKR